MIDVSYNKPPIPHAGFAQGYTYLAQMLSHDIVPATKKDCQTVQTSGFLNLDSLYGEQNSPYRLDLEKKGKFPEDIDRWWDLARNAPEIPESRNDENIVIAQLHLLFQRFHNYVFDTQKSGSKRNALRFESARELVIRIFQLLIVEDLLRQLLSRPVYDGFFGEGARAALNTDANYLLKIFRRSGFRFGHSMIRNNYKLRSLDENAVDLNKILRDTSLVTQPISPDLGVNWLMFFPKEMNVRKELSALRLDTHVSSGMKVIPPCKGTLNKTDIIQANLSASMNISVGDVVREIKRSLKDDGLNLLGGTTLTTILKTPNILDQPFWAYVLKEGEQYAEAGSPNGGILGPLTSIVIAESLKRSIAGAATTIFSKQKYCFRSAISQLGPIGKKIESLPRKRGNPRFRMNDLFSIVPRLSNEEHI